MISDQLRLEVKDWIKHDPDRSTALQLEKMLSESDSSALEKCFSGFLKFGTAGLRGPMGPGPSCMNRAVVSRTATAIATFMKKHDFNSVVIGRDARYGSDDFAKDSAEIFAGAGFTTYVLPRPLPTPVLAYAINKLKANVGIMVTASHNPASDNGYKVYLGGVFDDVNYHGSQIISPVDNQISDYILNVDKNPSRSSNYQLVSESLVDEYVECVAAIATEPNNLKIVYTPLHGVGAETLIKVFSKAKFQTPILVKEQEAADPDFPTTLFPNPEEQGVLDLAIKYAQENAADLIIANDPDADRCAVAINDINLGWKMLTGDQVGSIIGSYLIPKNQSVNAQVANSLVSSSLLSKIAAKHNLTHKETLTGFKWISKVENLIFGYEEALGYCIDPTNVNDKDGISAALIIAQIAADLKNQGTTINDYLLQLGQEYGFHSTEQISIRYAKLDLIDQTLVKVTNNPPKALGEFELKSIEDLNNSKSMPTVGIRLNYGNNIRVIIRPSGTEPKLKCYIEVVSTSQEESVLITSQIKQALTKVLS